MMIMCEIRKPYKCKCCNQEMLFFVFRNRSGIADYKSLFEKSPTPGYLYNFLSQYGAYGLKCIVCNKIFKIDWSCMYPEQLTESLDSMCP